MLIYFILLILGLALIFIGADYFLAGSTLIARRYGVPNLIIGLTIIAIGTSAPELGVNFMASISSHSEFALGNILGSNISNILLVFAISMLFVKKIHISKNSLNQIYIGIIISIILLMISIISFISGINMITQIEGAMLLLIGFIYWFYLYKITKANKERLEDENILKNKLSKIHSNKIVIVIMILSIAALFYGSSMVTKNAILIAEYFGISELIIAGTIVAIGTSLPELVTSIHAIRKRHYNLLIGGIVGSNIINTLFILGSGVLIEPISITKEAMPYLYLNILAPIFLVLGFSLFSSRKFKRWQAVILILVYVVFIYFFL